MVKGMVVAAAAGQQLLLPRVGPDVGLQTGGGGVRQTWGSGYQHCREGSLQCNTILGKPLSEVVLTGG